MRGASRISAHLDAKGETRLVQCGGTPPLTPRATGPHTVHLVATAGGPVPGDRAELGIDVGPGATLVVRASAATVALASPVEGADPSRWEISVRVADGGTLVMLGEPLVAARGCDHLATATVALLGDARLVWRDLIVPGRSGEPSGDAAVTLRVSRDGRPVLAQTMALGPRAPGWAGAAVTGGTRCIGSLLLAGPGEWRPAATQRVGRLAALTPLAATGAALGVAIGDAPDVAAILAGWLPRTATAHKAAPDVSLRDI